MIQISEAQNYQAKYANEHRSPPPDFQVGELVLLSTKNFPTRFRAKNAHKLQSPFIGPFRILEKISPVSFKIELPDSMSIHNVFYSGLLKRYHGDPPKDPKLLPVILDDGTPGYIVESLLRRRKVQKSYQYLVKWLGYPEYDASWEPRTNLLKDVPLFRFLLILKF